MDYKDQWEEPPEPPAIPYDVDPVEPEGPPVLMSLGDYRRAGPRPPARVVVPHVALSGRVTLLAAEEKAGKSTLMGEAAAALSNGAEFLGKPVAQGKVLWLALDEPLDDALERFIRLGAHDDYVFPTDQRFDWGDTELVVNELKPQLVVIDTLVEWAVSEVDDLNSARQWTPFLKRLRLLAQNEQVAVVLLHHFKKGSFGYADSRAIGAGVDIILEMRSSQENERKRWVKYRGRGVGHGGFGIEWMHGRYHMTKSTGW